MTFEWFYMISHSHLPDSFLFLDFINGWGGSVWWHFQQYFSYILAVSFIDGGNWSTRRKPPTFHKSLTNFITYLTGIRTYNFSGVHQWHDTCSYRFKFGCRLQLFHCSILVLKPRMINVRVSSLRDLGMRL